MAQIFASDRAQARPPISAPRSKAARPDDRLAALQAKADASAPTDRLTQLKPRQSNGLVQRVEEEEMLQGKFAAPLQRMEEEELQGKFKSPVQRVEEEDALQGKFTGTLQRKSANGGLPAGLRAGVEQLSGADMSNVRVHYNSPAPAQMQAHAYAQGNTIHVAPGQEQHVPHEAWHVAQQQQGRVQPTTELGGISVNDDPGLEREADTMGAKAAQVGREGLRGAE